MRMDIQRDRIVQDYVFEETIVKYRPPELLYRSKVQKKHALLTFCLTADMTINMFPKRFGISNIKSFVQKNRAKAAGDISSMLLSVC